MRPVRAQRCSAMTSCAPGCAIPRFACRAGSLCGARITSGHVGVGSSSSISLDGRAEHDPARGRPRLEGVHPPRADEPRMRRRASGDSHSRGCRRVYTDLGTMRSWSGDIARLSGSASIARWCGAPREDCNCSSLATTSVRSRHFLRHRRRGIRILREWEQSNATSRT